LRSLARVATQRSYLPVSLDEADGVAHLIPSTVSEPSPEAEAIHPQTASRNACGRAAAGYSPTNEPSGAMMNDSLIGANARTRRHRWPR
jgi:hypothetical protein